MELKLILIGGIYGMQALEPVDVTDLPGEQRAFASELASAAGTASDAPAAAVARTEGQTFRIEISRDDGTTVTHSWPESARARDPRLDQLIDTLWRTAKPAQGG